MSDAAPASAIDADRSWFIAQRWQQYEGEARANLLRITVIGTFYLIHLWTFFSSQGKLPNWGVLQVVEAGTISERFHVMVTLLAITWVMLAAGVHMALRSRFFPTWLPAVSTLGDVLFLTSVLLISAGPRSPLVVGYFLIVALSGLRFDVRLVQLSSVASVVGYVCLLGYAKWPTTFGRDKAVDLTVPRYEQLIVVAGLALTGVIVGQIVRRARQLVMAAQSSVASSSARTGR